MDEWIWTIGLAPAFSQLNDRHDAVAAPEAVPTKIGFRTVAGLRIRSAECGGETSQWILMTSPWPESMFAFAPIWDTLAQRFHVVAVDLPGGRRAQAPPVECGGYGVPGPRYLCEVRHGRRSTRCVLHRRFHTARRSTMSCGLRRVTQPLGARARTVVKAIVCVHHAGSAQWPRNASMDRSSRSPDATSRPRNSMTVRVQYSAHREPPL